jgi:transposase
VEATGGRVSVVARRHGISKSLLYNWRSAWKAAALVARGAAPSSAGFIQLGLVADPSYERPAIRMASGAASARSGGTGSALAGRAGVMEIDLPEGVRVRVDGGVDEPALRRVLSAVQGLR